MQSEPVAVSSNQIDAYETLLQFLYRAPIGLVETSLNGDIDIINPMAASLLMPLSLDGSLDNLFTTLSTLAPNLLESVQAFGASTGMVVEGQRLLFTPPEGSILPRQILELSVIKLDAQRIMASISDVTQDVEREQRGLARRLHDASLKDALTQLPNRAAVSEQVSAALARRVLDPSHKFAVLFMNCDRFKQVNDTFGQEVGDLLLQAMADRFRAALRQRDQIGRNLRNEDMAARMGGDEFVVLVDGLRSDADAQLVAARLLNFMSQPYDLPTGQVRMNISMGLALPLGEVVEANQIIQDASIAMVVAKRAGRGDLVVFEPAMRERAAQRGSLESDLHEGLRLEQFHVAYQPVVRTMGGGGMHPVAGVEALMRWRHPQRGEVPPLTFIGVAEECGLIDALGQFVLERACQDFLQWQRDLGDLAPGLLAVNLSRAQLAHPGLLESVRLTLMRTGMRPQCLQLEVTESLAAQDETVQQRLRELKELGLTLALDDFGTGYSSLACLHLLPVDTVKIDRSFVTQITSSRHHQVLVEATVNVAKSLGMGTVAEGIETPEQAQMVAQLGCEKAQGYWFSRPLSASALRSWLVNHRGLD